MEMLTFVSSIIPDWFWIGFTGFLVWWRIWQYMLKGLKLIANATVYDWDDKGVARLMRYTDIVNDLVPRIITLDPQAFKRAKGG